MFSKICSLLKEILYNFKSFTKDIRKNYKKSSSKKIWDIKNLDLLILKILNRKIKREVTKKIFHIKEEFLESSFSIYDILKKEQSIFYQRDINIYLLWLLYIGRPFYIFGNYFYLRQKKLFKLFNVSVSFKDQYSLKTKKNFKNIYWGFKSFWNTLKIWVFSLFFAIVSFYILLVKRSSILPQNLFFWLSLSMLLYWLLSGFVFFVKKYQFSRFTSVIQRFWRRSYILFWLIEGGLLLVFFYLTINSSQESFYMFDQGYFFKTHLFSWKLFVFKCILVVSLIIYSYLLLLNLKWSTYNKNILNLVFLTALLIYFVWIEFYQIYWVSNFYANFSWTFDLEDLLWVLEVDGRRTRILNHYIMVLFLLKFWHIIFIFGCWIFFLLRANELDSVTYPLYSFNFQNFIILFLMMWLFMYPWFKYAYHWLAEIPYYWFYVDTHASFYKIFITDIYAFYYNCITNIINIDILSTFNNSRFINWFLIDFISDYNTFIKYTIKNELLQKII